MIIIAKLSFWMQPAKKSIISKLLFQENQSFEQLIMNALNQFKKEGNVEKLKTCITSLPSITSYENQDHLHEFLCDLTLVQI
jgi:hypothetical protein